MRGQVSTEYLIIAALLLALTALIGALVMGAYGLSSGVSSTNDAYRSAVLSMLPG
jgi:hypothetical protein